MVLSFKAIPTSHVYYYSINISRMIIKLILVNTELNLRSFVFGIHHNSMVIPTSIIIKFDLEHKAEYPAIVVSSIIIISIDYGIRTWLL